MNNNSLSPHDLMEAVLLCLLTPMEGVPGNPDCLWGLTPNIVGDPGIAKTSIVKQLCRELGTRAVSLFASQHPPEDFSGALIPDGAGNAKQICPLGPVREILATGRGVIFLDEINTAPPATQAALQSFIHERRAGDQTMPGEVRIVAASNPEELATGGHRLAPAVANRLVRIEYGGGSVADWCSWNITSGTTKPRPTIEELQKKVEAEWPNEFPLAQGLMNGFVSRHVDHLHTLPARNSKEAGRAWPSRRTIDFSQRAWATAKILKTSDEVRDVVIEGCIGGVAAEDFNKYCTDAKLPHPTEVLEGKWTPDTNRLDITIGAYTAMVAHVAGKKDLALGAKAWKATGALLKTTPPLTDLVVPIVQALNRTGLGRDTQNNDIKEASRPILLALESTGIMNI